MSDIRADFIRAASVPRDSGHASGTLAEANAILAAHPEIATLDIHVAAIMGDDAAVVQWLERDPTLSTATDAPYGWDALTHLCFSKYLRLDASRSDGFVRAARALLDAGADPNTGFFETDHQPAPERESVLYGAAGVAHHEALTRLLLERGADPNDEETPYHAPEGYELGAFRALLETRRLNAVSLATMLLRKSDWHDLDGMKLALEYGASATGVSKWGRSPLAHAIRSDNRAAIVELLLDHGADPTVPENGRTPLVMAAWAGRDDLLQLFTRRGVKSVLEALDGLLCEIARGHADRVTAVLEKLPPLAESLRTHAPILMVRFAGNDNAAGINILLDIGISVNITEPAGDGYLDRAPHSTALHVAAARGRHELVALLVGRGADVTLRDGRGRTELMLAVRACVDSYWVDEQSTTSIAALLAAGASVDGVPYPSGYADGDALLAAHGAT